MSNTRENTFLVICILGIFGAAIWFYLFPVASRSWTMTIVSIPALLTIIAAFVTLPEVIKRVRIGFLYMKQWYFFLWFNLFIISVWIFRGRSATQLRETPVDVAALVRILSVAIAGVIVFSIALIERKDIMRQLSRGLPGLMLAYGLIGLASVFYSPYRALTLYKACEIIVDVGMIALFLSCYPSRMDMKRWIDLNWFMVAALIAVIWIEAILFPGLAFRPISRYKATVERALLPISLYGVMPIMNSNSVGFLSALLSIISLSRIFHADGQKKRMMYTLLLAVGLVTLVLSQARTSLFGGILAIIAVLLLNKRFKLIGVMILLLILVLFVYTGLPLLFTEYAMRGQVQKQVASLSGRMVYWTLGWEKFKQSPIFGYGFGAGTRFVVLLDVADRMSTIHNSWLEVLVNVGLLGFIPVALMFVGTWWTLLRTNLRPRISLGPTVRMLSIEMIAFLVLQTVRLSFGGGSFLHDRETLLLLLVVAYAQQIRNWERTGRGLRINENSPDTQSIQI